MNTPHAPQLRYLCDDHECCDNGCPNVTCRACGEEWPCADWRSRHSRTRVLAQYRYNYRKHFPGDELMVDHMMRRLPDDLGCVVSDR